MYFRRVFRASAAAIVAATALTVAPAAQAEQFDTGLGTMPIGEWGKVRFLTPNDPQFWDPTVTTPRIVSPRGTENLECKAFHGKATLHNTKKQRPATVRQLVKAREAGLQSCTTQKNS